MGFFSKLFGKSEPEAPPEPEAPAPDPSHLVVLREGMSTPTDADVAAIVAKLAPDHTALPARGLAQPRWWSNSDWIGGGLRTIGDALATELSIDPDATTYEIGKDPQGARCAVIFLYPKPPA